MLMKVISVDKYRNEKLVCESIDQYHGLLFVNLINQNYASKTRKIKYKLVECDYVMNSSIPFADLD